MTKQNIAQGTKDMCGIAGMCAVGGKGSDDGALACVLFFVSHLCILEYSSARFAVINSVSAIPVSESRCCGPVQIPAYSVAERLKSGRTTIGVECGWEWGRVSPPR